MKFLSAIFKYVANAVVKCIGKVIWHTSHVLGEEERAELNDLLSKNHYIILTRHDGYLSSYAIQASHLFLTGRLGYYAHALFNAEDTVSTTDDYRFIEATKVGVHYSKWGDVFNDQCSAVALLKPRSLSVDQWTTVLEKAKTYQGRPYDTLYDLADDQKISCVELVRNALRAIPTYDVDFSNFEKMIARDGNLDPHMFYECPDFEVVWEARH